MTPAQTALYFYQWGLARDWFLAQGLDSKQVDAKRHALHVKALGRDKSSKDFTNADLDKVIAAFKAVHDGGNLDAQLAQLDQPEKRREMLTSRLMAAGAKFITGESKDHVEWKVIAYAGGIVTKLGEERRWPIPDLGLLAKVMGIMERRAAQVTNKARAEEKVKAVEGGNPF